VRPTKKEKKTENKDATRPNNILAIVFITEKLCGLLWAL